jgi:fucose 4-O-acetylase-like acetyltransferase
VSLEDILRIINLVLAVFVFSWLLLRRFFNSVNYPEGSIRRDIWTMAMFWTLATTIGTSEQLFETDTYFRVGFTLAALLTTLSILIRPKDDWLSPS